MHGDNFFAQAFIYLLAAVISVPVAKRLGLGSVLGYLVAGIIIGPFVLGFIGENGQDVMHFAEFGVVIMLFLIGLELKPSLLWSMRRSIFGLGGLQVMITGLVVIGIALLFNMTMIQAIAIGMIFSLSSTAIVLQSLSEKGQLKTEGGQSSFSVLLFQDIAVIPMLAIIPLLAPSSHNNLEHSSGHGLVSELPGYMQLLIILALVAAIILSGRFLSRHIFRFIASTNLREIFVAFALLLVIGIALAMEQVGLSPALGTFLAGVVLADSEYRHELESDIEPFKGLLLGLFFIAVGASINFDVIIEKPAIIFGILGILIIVKLSILYSLGRIFKISKSQNYLFSFALAQGGEFAFVLVSFASQNHIFNEAISGVIVIIVALSMAITPLLLIINDKIIQPRFEGSHDQQKADKIDEKENEIIIAGFGRFGIPIGRLLMSNGFNATILDSNPKNIEVLRKFGFKVFYGDASRYDLLESAGAANAKVMVIAVDEQNKALQIAETVQKHFPNLKIFGRAFDNLHVYKYRKMGIEQVSRDTFDSALDLGIKTLSWLGFNKYQAYRAAKIYKHHDEEVMMKEMFDLWEGDKKTYIEEVRRRAEQLENILKAEGISSIHEADHAWDVTTLREEIIELVKKQDSSE